MFQFSNTSDLSGRTNFGTTKYLPSQQETHQECSADRIRLAQRHSLLTKPTRVSSSFFCLNVHLRRNIRYMVPLMNIKISSYAAQRILHQANLTRKEPMKQRLQASLRNRFHRGFTLVELLVVIAIIGILVGLLLPAVQMIREAARRTACKNNLRQIGLALLNYESAHQYFPPGQTWSATKEVNPNRIGYSWFVQTLPFIEQGNIEEDIDQALSPDHAQNVLAMGHVIPVALCPSTGNIDKDRDTRGLIKNFSFSGQTGFDLGCTDYIGISGPKGDDNDVLDQNGGEYNRNQGMLLSTKDSDGNQVGLVSDQVSISSITDGTSNTVFVTECTGRAVTGGDPHGAWISAKNITSVDRGVNEESAKESRKEEYFYSDHPGGVNALFVDGSVRWLPSDIQRYQVFWLSSRNGGEVVDEF